MYINVYTDRTQGTHGSTRRNGSGPLTRRRRRRRRNFWLGPNAQRKRSACLF